VAREEVVVGFEGRAEEVIEEAVEYFEKATVEVVDYYVVVIEEAVEYFEGAIEEVVNYYVVAVVMVTEFVWSYLP
jgi:hypothetical protein